MARMRLSALAGAMAMLGAGPALAHHSAAMFDMTKTLQISGTVKEWQFVNPHAWLQVLVADPTGKTVQWAFEGGAPHGGGDSVNSPLRKDTFRPGDKVMVSTHPMKDGRPAGLLGEVTFADGHKWTPPPPPK